MKKPLFVAATLFAVAALTAAAVASFKNAGKNTGKNAGRHAAASGGPASAGASAAAGRQRRWAIKLEARVQQPHGPEAPLDGTVVLTGDWVATVSGASEVGYDVACELEHPHVSGNGFGDVNARDVAGLEQSFGRRFWITYQPDGAATRVHFPRDMSDTVRNFLELVATQVQLVRSAEPAPQWIATERDGAGAYLAAYEQPAPSEIIKRKLRYVTVEGSKGPKASSITVRVDRSETRFDLDAEGRVDRVEGHEATTLDAKMGAPGLGIEIAIKMDQPRMRSAPELIGSLERARLELESGPVVTQRAPDEELQARRDLRLIKDVSLQELVEKLRGGDADGKAPARLEALLRQRASEIPRAIALAREAGGDTSKRVLHALGAAGTEAAQAALCGLAADDSAPAPLRVAALGGLVQTKRPTSTTFAALSRLMDAPEPSVRRQAIYMAGTAANNSLETNPAATARIEADLLERYAKCAGPGCLDLLAGLGNLATPNVVPPIERTLRDVNADLRASAVRALRNVKTPAANQLISTKMATDQAPRVRAAAIFAATFQPVAAFIEPLSRAAQADPVDYVRASAVQAIAGHSDESPIVESALVAVAAKDPKPGVRRLAREALGPRPAGLVSRAEPR